MKNQFIDQFSLLTRSSARVLFVPSEEPYRAAELLRNYAHSNGMPYKEWDIVHGWREFKASQQAPATGDNNTDFFGAVQMIDDIPGGYKKRWEEGVFVMHYPHWQLRGEQAHYGIIQVVKQYARSFKASKQRLAMLVPAGFTAPIELQHDVALCELTLPSREELEEQLDELVQGTGKAAQVSWYGDAGKKSAIISAGSGLTINEFRLAAGQAIVSNGKTWPNTPFADFLRVIMQAKVEAVKKSEVLEVMHSSSMKDVGGLENLKAWLSKCAHCFSPEAAAYGVRQPKGMSLIGPPGTGKSLSATAAADLLNVPLIRVDISSVFNSLVGESESRLREACKKLKAMSPCIAFVDEVDKGLGGAHQAGGDSGVTKRVLGYLLSFMAENEGIFWIFTANRVEGLDPALLRRGRVDGVFAVLPPNRSERLAILNIHLRKRKQDPSKVSNLELAVDASEGYVSAEIEAAIEESVRSAFIHGTKVTGEGIAKELEGIKPISQAFAEDFNRMTQWAANNAQFASLSDAEQVSTPKRSAPVRKTKGGREARAVIELGDDE